MAAKKTAKKSTESDIQAPSTPAAPAAKKAATKTAAKKAASTSAPKATKTAAQKTASPKASKAAAAKKPSLDEIARGAYLNYRSRVEQGLPGNSHSDWLEAERQLGLID